MAIFPSGLLIKNGSNSNNSLMLILLVASLAVFVFGQSRWQDVTTFHPYCVRLFRSCVESSSIGGVGSGDYNVAVGICGNKMAICTFSGNLIWPWSTNIGSERPASSSVDASSRVAMYRNILSESSPTVTPIPWQDLTEFLPECRTEFLRCVDTQASVLNNIVAAGCGHGMSVCTERQGQWPYGNDSSAFWQQSYTNDRLTLYRNVYSGISAARNWQSLTAFLPICRNLMRQCVPASGGASSNTVVGNCGNLMAICTSENVLWPHSYDASAAYTESYDVRWRRYANVLSPITGWHDIRRFSSICTDKFFECVDGYANVAQHIAFGVCGNYMSICTFNDSIWPNASQVPTTFSSYSARLLLYRAMLDHMLLRSPSYFTFPSLNWDLYSFSTNTFTNAGAIGRFGPTLSACRSAYSSQLWAQNSSFFNMTIQGIQEWMVPRAGNYRISVKGAAGGGTWTFYGGKGAFIEGTFSLQSGDVLCIVVGQMGVFGPWSSGGGGGGGSFVYIKSSNTLLIAAGGGGGGGSDNGYGGFGSSTSIPVNGGRSDNGGFSGIGYGGNGGRLSPGYIVHSRNEGAGGGGGWLGDGGNGAIIGAFDVGYGGKGRPGNFVGGYHHQRSPATGSSAANGGFGGGGGSGGAMICGTCGNNSGSGGGGGGGYTGGGGADNFNGTMWGGGQGGGSFNAGADQVNTPNNCNTHGSVTITAL